MKMILLISVLIFIILAVLLFMMDTVESNGEERIIFHDDIPSNINVILVLGAGIKDNGKPCEMLKDRLKMAIYVSREIKNTKILLSGDHSRYNYNEVGTMKEYIMKSCKNISESDIFLDHAGFSTYESIYRAKKIFKVNKMIIVTNKYHLPRALYIAKKLGIEAYGISSDMREYENIEMYKERELLAQVKDFIYTNLLKPEPKYLGHEIPINSSDGKITDDVFKNV